ncbi:hypothetical protein [Catenulispora rubra]|uniref:hypothetical protein n=1 Tax=Catenulispora rubra TaxID=280293 RepID=UPI0018922942|nr:hypothetical protein [Catenulispora rubra]
MLEEADRAAIEAYARDRERIRALLPASVATAVDEALALLAVADPGSEQEADLARFIAGELRATLDPGEYGPFNRGTGTAEAQDLSHLRLLLFGQQPPAPEPLEPLEPPEPLESPEPPDPLWQAVVDRVSAAPSYSRQALWKTFGQDPDDPRLIRLDLPGGAVRFPAFQFDGSGVPLPAVLAVNEILGAADDPWAVADWWLFTNPWLESAPVVALGTVSDETLVDAARAVVDWD